MKCLDNELVYDFVYRLRLKMFKDVKRDLHTRISIYFEQIIYNEFENGFIVDELDRIMRNK